MALNKLSNYYRGGIMLEFEDFEKYMLAIKEQIKKEHKLDEALREMSPDFGGFST